jgi:membrane protein implicated in regulation of membrane protease activity
MPFMGPLTIVLVVLILFATVELIAPGLGDHWFAGGYTATGWVYSEKWVYLLTELVPVLVFAAVGVLFWWLGRRTREEVLVVAAETVAAME